MMATMSAVAPARASVSVRGRPAPVSRATIARPAKGRGALVVVANEKQGKGGEEGGVKFDRSCFGIVASNANYVTLGSAIQKAGLKDALMAPGPLTVFAPNDDAFADVIKALKTTKLGLMELPNLGDILKNHVVAGAIMSSDLKEGQELTTLGGGKLKVSLAGGASVNGIKVTKADIKTTNGVIHAVKSVIVPK